MSTCAFRSPTSNRINDCRLVSDLLWCARLHVGLFVFETNQSYRI